MGDLLSFDLGGNHLGSPRLFVYRFWLGIRRAHVY